MSTTAILSKENCSLGWRGSSEVKVSLLVTKNDTGSVVHLLLYKLTDHGVRSSRLDSYRCVHQRPDLQ
jgi:hypothetical protein